jgi:hypothetical protein
MAVVSGGVAVLWMTRSAAARFVTILYAAAWLARNTIYLFPKRFGVRIPVLPPGARQLLLLDSFAQALIFLYLLFYLRTAQEKQKLKA